MIRTNAPKGSENMNNKVITYIETMDENLRDLERHLDSVAETAAQAEEDYGQRFPLTSALRCSASHALNLLYDFLEAWDIYRYTLYSVQGEAVLAEVQEFKGRDRDETD